ncbi:dimethylamine monooxygenase subunit DmmA family protein [Pleurocapsa sp. FMAR1]|uniref:dimethylamine monooxygenase subunit DmmA family protein n=1 Tax=Pleurocapsa sp. FMAR1 TaxID=3040204 RepID=UPI0029C99460|nr:dimethylamine monooxygenase subunit DmmA family protein [Pleurocapsa sp. FMAR1]
MRSVPQPTKLKFDLSASLHLICVEKDAINLVCTKLNALEYIPVNLQIFYQGAIAIARKDLDIEQFDSTENLEARLQNFLQQAYMGTRFYAVGSEQFVQNLRRLARSFGMLEEEIHLEIVNRKVKNIYCSTCHRINPQVQTNIITCSGCGIKLEVWEHFSRLKNAYLGVCADAE